MTDNTDEWLASLENDPHPSAVDASDLRAIGEALIAVEAAEVALRIAVAGARALDRSWTEIANVLGVSRQAARQRFARDDGALESVGFSAESMLGLMPVLIAGMPENEVVRHFAEIIAKYAGLPGPEAVVLVPAHDLAGSLVDAEFVHKRTKPAEVEAWLERLTAKSA